MFTLSFPIQLPPEHTFFDNGQYPVPPLPGGLSVKCISNEHAPLVLQISGFSSQQDAIDFCPVLRMAICGATLQGDHSMTPSGAPAVASQLKMFDGSVPTVTATALDAKPYHASMQSQNGLHISVLARAIGACLTNGLHAKLNARPELKLSVELFSEFEFTGGANAQFVMLLTALEILLPNTSSKGKRGAVVALVKNALSAVGHPDPKTVGKKLDDLYVARNALVHDAKAISVSELVELEEIVRDTLKALTV